MRLDRFLSNNTEFSRKEIHQFIKNDKVKVNNKIVNSKDYKIDNEVDTISLNDILISESKNIYIALNKPKGYLCTNSYNEKYPSILELLPIEFDKYNLHIVGRLDLDTTGLIILTNDGKFTHYIKSPKSNIEKEYDVILRKDINELLINRLLSKKIIIKNKLINEFKINYFNRNNVKICLTDGKYHEVKTIFKYIDNEVVELKRIRIGNLKLDDLKIDIGNFCLIEKNQI